MENKKEEQFEKKSDTDLETKTGLKGEEESKFDLKKEVIDFLKVIIIALVITNLLNVFVFTLSQVHQSSMESTLIAGDQLVIEKLSYTFSQPKRGDIIVFIGREITVDNSIIGRFARLYKDMYAKITRQEGHFRFVKRIIGVPGDEIDIRDGKVYINDEEYKEEYVNQPTFEKSKLEYPFIVPAGQYFVLGDNRGRSLDSRDFDCIKLEQIEGKVWIRFWPLNKLGGV